MPFKIKYDAEQDCILASITESLTRAVVHEYFIALDPVLKETGCYRVLSDCSQSQILLSSLDIMQFPKMVESLSAVKQSKRAVLFPSGSSGYELYGMVSKSEKLRVFTDKEEAMKWLMEPLSNSEAE